jgi:hypothetical protein
MAAWMRMPESNRQRAPSAENAAGRGLTQKEASTSPLNRLGLGIALVG